MKENNKEKSKGLTKDVNLFKKNVVLLKEDVRRY